MDKMKISKKDFDDYYEIEQEDPKGLATDTSSEEEVKEQVKEETVLTEEEEAQDKALEEALGWDTE